MCCDSKWGKNTIAANQAFSNVGNNFRIEFDQINSNNDILILSPSMFKDIERHNNEANRNCIMTAAVLESSDIQLLVFSEKNPNCEGSVT